MFPLLRIINTKATSQWKWEYDDYSMVLEHDPKDRDQQHCHRTPELKFMPTAAQPLSLSSDNIKFASQTFSHLRM